ncbi:DUF6124 family protein [Pseudomonas mandelii]|uniref:DUF6124 family protein n=1 Tax=Pseudomonas mandelii TaxID=75612 RepID=UPI003F5AC547
MFQELHDEKVSTRFPRPPPTQPSNPTHHQRPPPQPKKSRPISHVFTLLPNIDTETLLSHACETLASLNVLTTDFACELEGSHRSLALSIQQLAVLGELLVNRALDNLDPPGGAPDAQEVQP